MIRSIAISLIFLLLQTSVFPQTATETPEFQTAPADIDEQAKPPVKNIAIQFVGNTKFSENELRNELAEHIDNIAKNGLTPSSADDTAFFLGVFYRKHGYSKVEVQETITPGSTLTLRINEGPLTEIGKMQFEGNEKIESKTLEEYLIGATRERFSRLQKTLPYIEADIKTGVDRIRGLYLAQGFLESDVANPIVTFEKGESIANITLQITEGTQYILGKINISGDLVFFPQNPDLEEQIKPFANKPYTPLQITNIKRAVVYFYKTRGYFNAKVTAEADPALAEDGIVPVHLNVETGDLYRFDGIEVKGLDRLRPSFMENRFRKLHGKFYNPEKIDEIFRELMQTGLFNNLRIQSKPLPGQEIQLYIETEEAKAKELGFSIGYGTFEGPFVGFSAADRNLFGSGRPLSLTTEIAQRYIKGELLYVDPWLFESNYRLRQKLYGLTQDFDGYSKFEIGNRTEISRNITKHYEAGAFLLLKKVSTTSTGIDELELGRTSYLVNSIGISQTLEHRDSVLNPRKGWILTGSLDYATSALGSSIEFLRGTYRLSYYLPLKETFLKETFLKNTLVAFGARGGAIYAFDGIESIPIDERFFNGGSRSVRSFAERELGPKDSHGFPIGGQAFSTFNIEYVFPIIGDLEGAAFVDTGSVSGSSSEGLGEMRYGIGAGLRYKLPVGPLRLDYGINPSPRKDEEIGAFHFSFGFAF